MKANKIHVTKRDGYVKYGHVSHKIILGYDATSNSFGLYAIKGTESMYLLINYLSIVRRVKRGKESSSVTGV